MSMLTQNRRIRWLFAPALAVAMVVATLTLSTSASATDHPRLPPRTAAQLLTAVQQVDVVNFSGTVKMSTKLGLPSLPDSFASGGGLSLQTLLAGSHTFRVWARGVEQQRLALLGGLAETDVVHNNNDLWTYDSMTMQVTHATLSSAAQHESATSRTTAETPSAVADQALKAIDPSTAVTVDRTARVAGRPAYQLVLTPRDARTLIGRVQIAIDSKTSLPLRVEVFTRHSSRAAIHVAFSSISFSTPKASIFHFTPPKGAKVQPATVASLVGTGFGPSDAGKAAPEAAASPGTSAPPRVLGKGWTSVAVIGAGKLDPSTSKMLDRMSSRVPTGRLITTALASVLVADDGHIYVGAVTAADLQTVAATGRAL